MIHSNPHTISNFPLQPLIKNSDEMKYPGFKPHLLKFPTLYFFLVYTGNSHNLEDILHSYYNKVVSVINSCFNSKAI